MIVRNYKGKMVKININNYSSEKQLYNKLWEIMFNIKNSCEKKIQKYIFISFIFNCTSFVIKRHI